MLGELNVGHAYYSGGDVEQEPSVSVGMLGVDFELSNGAYKITRIYRGAPWDADARGPLGLPGVKVREGDYLLAVNGTPVDPAQDPWAAFIGLAGKTVAITVSAKPKLDADARDVMVQLAGDEGVVRYRAWIERNRAYVARKTADRVGYIYVPDTGVNGQNDLMRQIVGQRGKDALIIDERWNGGGQVPNRFVELLNRPITNYWTGRYGNPSPWPPDAANGPKCMLINGMAGSGGDLFPWIFRHEKVGKLIGARTWGGVVGIGGIPPLIDGASLTAPNFAFFENEKKWGIEGHGVDPDIEVVDDPSLMADGGDPQLDAAIHLMMDQIKDKPWRPVRRPPYPNRTGMGLPPEER
jgi:tricorn protease